MRHNYILPVLIICLFVRTSFGATYLVTNNSQTGTGSLAQAIIDANNHPGLDSIHFAIPFNTVEGRTITLSTALPAVTSRVIIDANSQRSSKYFGVSQTRIQLVATSYLSSAFTLTGDSIEVYGFFIHHFVTGIVVTGSYCRIGANYDGNVILDCTAQCIHIQNCKQASLVGNFIGVDTTGKDVSAVKSIGILVENGSKISIGGKQPGGKNIISGNTTGLELLACTYIALNKNYVGTDNTGSVSVPNITGIYTDSFCNNVQIGGDSTKEKNVISGNTGNGIETAMNTSSILGNAIGTDSSGLHPLGNAGFGIYVLTGSKKLTIGKVGGTSGNVIANNGKEAIYFQESLIKTITIRGNSMFCNSQISGNGGIFIDGGNGAIAPPDLEIVNSQGVTGVALPNAIIDVYLTGTCSKCEGKTFLITGSANANGVFNFFVPIAGTVTALATDVDGNTSEFAVCKDNTNDSCLIAGFITDPVSACSGSPIKFLDQSVTRPSTTITSWLWTFPNGDTSTEENPTEFFTVADTFQVTLKVTNNIGCTSTVSNTLSVFDGGAKASFTGSTKDPCVGDAVQFTDESTTIDGSKIISWTWDFGDGSTSTLQNPSHAYTTAGDYSVTLTIENDFQCGDTHTSSLTVHEQPEAKFVVDSADVCLGTQIQFTDSSKAGNGATIISYNWDFGDGSTNTNRNPSHYYTTPGTYTATLTVETNFGCTDSFSMMVTTHDFPKAQFSTGPRCIGSNVIFTDESSADSSTFLVSWKWDFGDGDSSTDRNPKHLYDSLGAYTVILTVTNNLGCTGTHKEDVIIQTGPVVSFSISDSIACQGTPITFTDQTDTTGTLEFWHWNFGDGTSANTQDTTHSYSTAGIFTVTLQVVNRAQCLGSLDKQITILEQPTAKFFVPVENCMNEAVNFIDQSTSGAGATITSWQWDFGDGVTSTVQNPAHQYAATGTYQVVLTVQNSLTCTNTYSQSLNVIAAPQANFTYSIDYPSVEFTNTSLNSARSSYKWDFGDGNTSTLTSPIHIYSSDASYNVCLLVTDSSCGSSDSTCETILITGIASVSNALNQSISVSPNPAADFIIVSTLKKDVKIESIRMLNVVGEEVSFNNSFSTPNSIRMMLPELAEGMYLLQVQTDHGFALKKIFHLVK